MPAIVALVAANFPPERRSAAYGLVAAAGAMAVAAGPLVGGAVTTFASWRYVFVGEVVIVLAILALLRRITDVPPVPVRLRPAESAVSVLGLGLVVFGALRSTDWGWVLPQPGAPRVLGTSPVIWLILAGVLVCYAFVRWEARLEAAGTEPLLRVTLLRNRQLSVALLVVAIGLPRVAPRANPRRVVRAGLAAMIAGIWLLVAGMDPGAGAAVVAVPMLAMGLGMGALASQLGAVTVSAVPDSESAEVGGLQNTATSPTRSRRRRRPTWWAGSPSSRMRSSRPRSTMPGWSSRRPAPCSRSTPPRASARSGPRSRSPDCSPRAPCSARAGSPRRRRAFRRARSRRLRSGAEPTPDRGRRAPRRHPGWRRRLARAVGRQRPRAPGGLPRVADLGDHAIRPPEGFGPGTRKAGDRESETPRD